MKGKLLKGTLTVVGAVVLSTLGIFAADSLQGIDRNLVGLSSVGTGGACPTGMVLVQQSGNDICVDEFETSAAEGCPHVNPGSVMETETNANNSDCYPVSDNGRTPWRFVSLSQAQRLCASSGKRLPTSDEWYGFALGTEPESCVTEESGAVETGSSECVSSSGVHDAVGNVWEWVDETVTGRSYAGRALPETGYVASVDASGVAITSSEEEQELYGDDYFWSKEEGVFGMIRGGYYGSEDDAGLYTINASVQTSFASQGIGFRCVMDI